MAHYKQFKSLLHQVCLHLLWQIAALCLKVKSIGKLDSMRVILITADSQGLIGSRGDAAMLAGALDQIRSSKNGVEVFVACATRRAEIIAPSLNCKVVRVWGGVLMPFHMLRTLFVVRPSAVFVMGADIMDGHYSPVMSMRMLISADLAARVGSSSRFLGFSLNSTVPPLVKLAFRLLDGRVRVNLRDPISLKRHQEMAGDSGHLVADTAFLLKPSISSSITTAALEWIDKQRQSGRLVLGINFHPMLFPKGNAPAQTQKLAISLNNAMGYVQGQRQISWLLVPHDDREEAGDMSTLASLEAQLLPSVRNHAYRIETPPSAGDLKTIAGALDGVVTGRMHLAIATLGQGVPVLTFAYQGKFEGLMMHFDFPDWVVADPQTVSDGSQLNDLILRFVDGLPELRAQVSKKLPAVLEATQATFKGL